MSNPDLSCSFCGRPKPETQLLIAGLDAHICDQCINQAHDIVQDETNIEDASDFDTIDLKPPKEIKTFLDTYVIGQEESKKVLSDLIYFKNSGSITKNPPLIQPSSIFDFSLKFQASPSKLQTKK